MKRLARAAAFMIAPFAIAAVALAAGGGSDTGTIVKGSIVYKLSALNGSGQSGTVTLKALGEKTQVTIALTGEPAAAVEFAHIHAGACPTPGAVKYPLTSVQNGASVTLLDEPIGEISKAGFAVVVHKAHAMLVSANYVACGDFTHGM